MKRSKGILHACDLFCGAGGTTTGAEMSGKVKVVLAVNCWPTAIASHQKNHPHAMHVCKRIEHVDPRQDKSLPEFDLLMASPECTHHSIARGGRPIDDQRRATPWDVLNWMSVRRPRWLLVENVREFRDWGPIDAQGRPIKNRKGDIYRAWVKSLESLGYQVDAAVLNAADFGAATKRLRLFIVARRGWSRRDIPWPEITHSKANWTPAWRCIDWSRPCPSIFARKRPLAENTLRRIEIGLKKFVGEAAEPFIVHFRHRGSATCTSEPIHTVSAGGGHHAVAMPFQFKAIGRNPGLTKSVSDPLPTIVAARENHAVVMPFLTQFHNGPDGERRNYSPADPLPCLDTQNRYGLVTPFIVPHFGERPDQEPRTHGLDEPLPTITGQGAGSLAMPFFLPRQGHFDCHRDKPGASIDDPLNTITANHGPGNLVVPFLLAVNHGGEDHRSHDPREPLATLTAKTGHSIVVPWLTKYYGTGGVQSVLEPIDTITAKDRFGLAMASLIETMQALKVVDIGFRMLDVDELAAAQGFPAGYELLGTKADRVRQIGNSVSPLVAKALCEAIADAA